MAMNYEIEETLAVLSEPDRNGYQKELNLVSWNDRKPKYDIRAWKADHTEMKRGGIVLNKEEMQGLVRAAMAHMGEVSDGKV